MILHSVQGITDTDSWLVKAPPAKGKAHWKPGRSAYELAAYMTKSLDTAPAEIEQALRDAGVNTSQCFDWDGEVVTDFAGQGLGRGFGRHHDAALWNDDVFVGIEAKADEPLDRTVSELMSGASGNRMKRMNGLCRMIWGDDAANHPEIRYQLLTALGGVLLEANGCTEKRGGKKKKAILLILTFLKKYPDGRPYTSSDKVDGNKADVKRFLNSLPAYDPHTGRVKTAFGDAHDIDVYVRHITISG